MEENNHYKTSDTSLASFLITENFYLVGIDYNAPRYEYLFRMADNIQEYANNYLSGNAMTNPSAFSRVNKKLLRVIHRRVQWEEY